MASGVKFQAFVEALAHGEHDLETDQLAVALTNSAPDASSDSALGDLTEIDYSNLSSRNITTSNSAQSGGTYKLTLTDLTLTASGSVGPFRYVVVYNDDHASDGLIAYYDHGESVELEDGE